MIDWTKSMQQTFDFFVVNPSSWRNETKLNKITSCTITRDEEEATKETATIECEELVEECYVRVYLVCVQDKERGEFPLGTFLVQTPTREFDGMTSKHSMDAYSPLLELKDSKPPYGYAVLKNTGIMERVYDLASENCRAPVVVPHDDEVLEADFVSDFDNDSWLSFLTDLAKNAKFKFALDELGRILFSPDQTLASLQPVWTYNDDNSSILLPEVSLDRDLYGIPNVVEVLVSNDTGFVLGVAENTDDNSPISIQNRGRRVVYRETNPSGLVNPTQAQIDDYAENLLEKLSVFECKLTYTHGYCPVRVGDCVRLNYERAGINNVKAKVVSQSIKCKPGCPVTEKAVFTTKLWGVVS